MATLRNMPSAQVDMLIRKPVEAVFEAFVDPAVTTKFWFTKSSGRLELGSTVRWGWEMYGVSTNVRMLEIASNNRILIEWGESAAPSTVEWVLTPRAANETFVSIMNAGFRGDADDIVAQAIDATQGFSFVLAGLKALLEHNVVLNLVADKAPDAHVKH